MPKVNLSKMTIEALMDLREQVDETLLKRRAEIEKQLARMYKPVSGRNRREVLLHRQAPGDLGRGLDVRGARCLAGRLLCLADTPAQSAQPERRRAWCGQLPGERPDLW